MNNEDKSTPDIVDDDSSEVNSTLTSHEQYVQHLVNENEKLKQKQIELENKITNKCECKKFSQKSNFIEHLLKDDKTCCHYTGLDIKTLKSIYIYLKPGERYQNVILYNNKEILGNDHRGRRRSLSSMEAYIATLIKYVVIVLFV